MKKIEIEKQKLALSIEEQKSKRVVDDRAIMFIDPSNMDDKARKY